MEEEEQTIAIDINQVEYTNSPDGPVIHVFGRDVEGTAHQIDVDGFIPYFYVPTDETGTFDPEKATPDEDTVFTTIRGEDVRRIYVRDTHDMAEMKQGRITHEGDIPVTKRFMLDLKLMTGLEVPSHRVEFTDITPVDIKAPARVCMLDIECTDERGFPKPDRDEVICLTCWDSKTDKYTSFLYTPADGKRLSSELKHADNPVFSYETETQMLYDFLRYIRDLDPDIISGWNVEKFDIMYLLGRLETLGIPKEKFARLPGRSPPNKIRGRLVFDLLEAYKKLQRSALESYRLDAVAEKELGEKKVRYSGRLCDLWRNDPAKLIEYNVQDVKLCVGIDKKNHIIEFYREIARYVGCTLDRTLSSSQIVDTYVLRKANGRVVLPSTNQKDGDAFEGATVFTPSKGLRENVVVFDLKSLYPMIMVTLNASLDTKDPKGEIVAPNGVRFKKEPDGLTREIIQDLLVQRDEKKRLRNTYAYDAPEYHIYDMQQEVLKVIMNTYYGVSGMPVFRLYDRDIGSAVTATGRAIIEHTQKTVVELGHTAVYGDTDSVLAELSTKSKDLDELIVKAREVETTLNQSYDKFAKDTLNVDKHYFSTKFEKVYRRFFQAGKKKRYAGHLVWKEGVVADKIDIVGFETRRSDTPKLSKKVLENLITSLLDGKDQVEIKKYLKGIIRDYRKGTYTLDEIGIPSGITKEFKDYKTNEMRVRSAVYSNTYLGTNFGMGSKPKRVYIKSVRDIRYPPTDVLSFEFEDQVPKEFEIDYEEMLTKTLKDPIMRMVDSLGWTWESIDPTMTTLSQWGMG